MNSNESVSIRKRKIFLLPCVIALVLLCGLAITSCLHNILRSQRHSWNSQKHQGFYLKTISFPDENNGWVAGKQGVIWHSTNGGSTWLAQSSQTQETLNKIFFVDAQEGWAVGSNGIIIYTNDGGVTWGPQNSVTSSTLNDVFFLNNSQGWIVGNGGVILTTIDGGAIWTKKAVNTTTDLFGVHFVDPNHGWAVGAEGEIWVTTNGGGLWGPQNSTTSQDLRSVYFINSSKGFAAGGDGFTAGGEPLLDLRYVQVTPHKLLLRTDNGGASWSVVFEYGGDPLHRVVFADPDHGWIAAGGEYYVSEQVVDNQRTGPTGAIFYTEDGGANWDQQYGGLVEPVYDIWFLDQDKGFAVGADTGQRYSSTSVPGRASFSYAHIEPVSSRIRTTIKGGRP